MYVLIFNKKLYHHVSGQMVTLLGTPRHVIPGPELGAINSYGNTPAPHRFRLAGSAFRLAISDSARLTSAANSWNASTISPSPVHVYGSGLSPRYSSSTECVDRVSITVRNVVA